jgi:hypothetical protein
MSGAHFVSRSGSQGKSLLATSCDDCVVTIWDVSDIRRYISDALLTYACSLRLSEGVNCHPRERAGLRSLVCTELTSTRVSLPWQKRAVRLRC